MAISKSIDLQKIANKLAKEIFNMELDVPVSVNKRLDRTMGRVEFSAKTKQAKKIEVAEKVFDYHSYETLMDILKHELCHWYVNKQFGLEATSDSSPIFKRELAKINAPASIPFAGKETELLCACCNKILALLPQRNAKLLVNKHNRISTCCKTEIILGKTIIREERKSC